MMEYLYKALDQIIFLIGRLSFQLSNERRLLEDRSIENVSLVMRKGSQKYTMEVLAIQAPRVRERGVGQ